MSPPNAAQSCTECLGSTDRFRLSTAPHAALCRATGANLHHEHIITCRRSSHARTRSRSTAPDQYTVEQFLTRWLDEVICHRRPRTQESYRGTVRLHIIPYVGAYKLQKLQPEHVQAMVNALAASGLGARSVEYAALVLSRGLNQAKRWGYVSKNAVTGVEFPDVKRRKSQPADEQQARALLEAVKGHRLEALYWVTLFLGLRRGEVLGLLKENIDWKTKTITIDGSLQRVSGRLQGVT